MVGVVIEQRPPLLLRLKFQLRDVHPAVWRRVMLADSLSIADLHRVIQLLMGWDDDHLHRFRIHGRDYGGAVSRLLVWTAPGGIECARMRSLLISDKGDRPWNRLAASGWIRRNTFFSFMG
jgi:hypothetical protein